MEFFSIVSITESTSPLTLTKRKYIASKEAQQSKLRWAFLIGRSKRNLSLSFHLETNSSNAPDSYMLLVLHGGQVILI
jgi:hypothetical protein